MTSGRVGGLGETEDVIDLTLCRGLKKKPKPLVLNPCSEKPGFISRLGPLFVCDSCSGIIYRCSGFFFTLPLTPPLIVQNHLYVEAVYRQNNQPIKLNPKGHMSTGMFSSVWRL